jgi:hypothetical protein
MVSFGSLQKNIQTVGRVFIVTFIALGLTLPFPAITSALSGSDFHPGRIIDNAVFYNNDALSTDQIQAFLNKQVPNCDTNGSKIYSGSTTRAQYGASRGYPAPYTCLKSFSENGVGAAQIIKNASQAYGINPQVLLVTLQKESSLVTDDWPWPSQYKTAMGYGCPDSGSNNSANCDSQYYGFTNQVTNAAKQFRRYATSPNSFNFISGATVNIQFNPNTGCGSRSVYIENQATASLYNYTPYQPNQAALDNLYGTGDGCSAYGNRNFWRIFNEWFGSTYSSDRNTDITYAQRRIQPVNYNGQPYVFYYDSLEQDIRVATQDPNNGWQFSVLDGVGGANGRRTGNMGSSIAAGVYNNKIYVFYYDKTNGNLRLATFNGSTWDFANLDGDLGSFGGKDSNLGMNISMTTYADTLQVTYEDLTNGNLRHAWQLSNGTWNFENLDGDPGSISHKDGDVGLFTSMVNYNGGLQLFYFDQNRQVLRHAWTDTTRGWQFEDLDGNLSSVARNNAAVGVSPSVTVYDGTIQLYYYDAGRTNVRHAWASATRGWQFEDLDGDGNTAISRSLSDSGLTSGVAVVNNSLKVLYYDRSSGNLRTAWTTQTGWQFANLDGDPGSFGGQDGDVGFQSGVMDLSGSEQVFYYNRTTGSLRHAWTDTSGWHFEDLGPTVVY